MRQEPFGLRRVILGHRGSSDRIRGSEHNQWGTGARRRGTSSTSRGAAQGNLSLRPSLKRGRSFRPVGLYLLRQGGLALWRQERLGRGDR